MLALAFQDWGAELLANAAFFNAWVADTPSLPAGHLVSAGGEQVMAIELARPMKREDYVLVLA